MAGATSMHLANEATRTSRALQLAARSAQHAYQRPAEALLLAVASVQAREVHSTLDNLATLVRWRGRELRGFLWDHRAPVSSVIYNPSGKALASAGEDRTIILWDVVSRVTLSRGESFFKGHTASVSSMAFSPDGERLASAGAEGMVILWELPLADVPRPNFLIPRPQKGHTSAVSSVAFSPDGMTLASASFDGTVRLWDTTSWRSPARGEPLRGHRGTVWTVAFSRDGKLLASGGEDGLIVLWDAVQDVATLTRQACAIVNRDLSHEEWLEFMGRRPDRVICRPR